MAAGQDRIQDVRTQTQLSWHLPRPRALSTSTELPLVARTPSLVVRRTHRRAVPGTDCAAQSAKPLPKRLIANYALGITLSAWIVGASRSVSSVRTQSW
jgi:hypothetical protein